MRERIERFFEAIVDGVRRGIADVRSKLIEEGFWGRHVPETSDRDGLQALWGMNSSVQQAPDFLDVLYQKQPGLFEKPLDEMSYAELDHLFEAYPKFFNAASEIPTHDQGHGIDR
jgi:hypothetical protein